MDKNMFDSTVLNRFKITVALLTYNRANFLKYSIESILNQTFQDFELKVKV